MEIETRMWVLSYRVIQLMTTVCPMHTLPNANKAMFFVDSSCASDHMRLETWRTFTQWTSYLWTTGFLESIGDLHVWHKVLYQFVITVLRKARRLCDCCSEQRGGSEQFSRKLPVRKCEGAGRQWEHQPHFCFWQFSQPPDQIRDPFTSFVPGWQNTPLLPPSSS